MKVYITSDEGTGYLALWHGKRGLRKNSRGVWTRGSQPALSEDNDKLSEMLPEDRKIKPGEIIALEVVEVKK